MGLVVEQSPWVLKKFGKVLVDWGKSHGKMDRGLVVLEGRRFEKFEISRGLYKCSFNFDGGYRLELDIKNREHCWMLTSPPGGLLSFSLGEFDTDKDKPRT